VANQGVAKKDSSKTSEKEPVLHSVTSFAVLVGVARNQIERMIKAGAFTTQTVNGQLFLPAKTAFTEFNAARLKLAAKLNKGAGAGNKRSESKAGAHETIFDAETKEKVFKAKLTEIKYLEQAGRLVDADEVGRRAFERGRKTRDAILLVPSRFAAELAVITDPHEIEVFLTRELIKALDKIVAEESNQLETKEVKPNENPS